MTHHKDHGKKGGFPLFQLALGAALAIGAGYYATHKEEVDKEAKKKIDQLAKMFRESRPQIERKVKKAWGEVSNGAIATYLELRGQLLHALEEENLEKSGKMVREHYDKIVDEVIKRARKASILAPDVEKKLSELFKMDWEDVRKMLMKLMDHGMKKTASAVRKAKVAGKVKAVERTVKKAAKKAKSVAKKAGKKRR